ncbi:YdeI/OmpD-associated family protein [Sporolactobacillus shoreicorticis]|uniref:YdeI/OmpD-associated family protein n=1 Tax=Sporolactobacillus shoreicorticis TaxID=1923877 RepID=A0ABW5RYV1_9BACL|nr:YdeI/OmpD-associated family protein [Sporolactobacillus shoreicorticis]MCO7127591.1 YdeI/OmpD-associated family protein [Sporolactobacillus shoreicorticis]
MAESRLNPKVDEFLKKPSKWTECYVRLRAIALDCGLAEEFKWMHPCYTVEGKNVVLIHGFKDYCALLFHKGALLKDARRILVQQTENVQAARQIRFTTVQEIVDLEDVIKAYIHETIDVEKAGRKVAMKKRADNEMPDELAQKFEELPELKTAFEALTPGRQNAYIFYIAQAKRSATRTARIEKNMPRILQGKGLNDCVCGHSKRMPSCDGSHKHFQ